MLKKICNHSESNVSFGTTSAIITNLGIIAGLDKMVNPKLNIIAGMLVVALADNIADSFGIHIYQESECVDSKRIWFSTFGNFMIRLFVSLTFILFVAVLPINTAVPYSICWGLLLLSAMSYEIARNRKVNPYLEITKHIFVAVFVVLSSHFVGNYIIGRLKI